MKREAGASPLHRELRLRLCRQIFEGEWKAGERIPTERELAERHGVSRITVRTTLADLEREGLLARRQGHGTRLRMGPHKRPSPAKLVAVLAPVENPFFASMLGPFEAEAEEQNALVVVKQLSRGRTIEETLFRFLEREIRSALVWPYDEDLDTGKLLALRALGMNLVFFDREISGAPVDSISVDSEHAVSALVVGLQSRGARRIAYVGWEGAVITSSAQREDAFRRRCAGSPVFRLPWRREREVDGDLRSLLAKLSGCDALLCGNGVIGAAAARWAATRNPRMTVACVDRLPGSESLGLLAYEQPMEALAREAWKALVAQGAKPAEWKPRQLRRRGRVVSLPGMGGVAAP
ncbi:MAG: GntR family transcriptional regulator [Spirochaetes bacterium]|nr:GntR family transcriptional regulator [Spirochaetota bacterium]